MTRKCFEECSIGNVESLLVLYQEKWQKYITEKAADAADATDNEKKEQQQSFGSNQLTLTQHFLPVSIAKTRFKNLFQR